MKKLLALLVLTGLIFVVGCSWNPTSPSNLTNTQKTDDIGTFEDTLQRLDTPTLIATWIHKNRKYDSDKKTGWIDFSGITKFYYHDIDNSYKLAQAFFNKTGLLCGNFTGFVLMCARSSGMECGGIGYNNHITAWIKFDNKYYFFNNGRIAEIFDTLNEMYIYFRDFNNLSYWNDKLVKY